MIKPLTTALILLTTCANAHGENFDFKQMEARVQATIDKAMPAVVSVGIKGRPGGFSAVIVSEDGFVLTAAHCVFASQKKKDTKYVVRLADGRTTEAVALGYCNRLDCALMKITKEGKWPVAEMGDSSMLVTNQPCVGISHPAGHNKDRGAVVRFGRIKQALTPVAGMIQSTCRIEPGDSGGPLFDMDGKIIGINSQIRSDLSRNYQVAINTFHEYWEKLKKQGSFNPQSTPGVPPLGLSMQNTRTGIKLTRVKPDTIGGKSELKSGDRIKQVNKRRVMTGQQLTREYIKIYQSGAEQLSLTVKTGDEDPREVILDLPERQERTGEAIPELENLIGELAELEARLDDTSIVIVSQHSTRPMSVFGTRVSADGLVISKSSQVGDDNISVKLRTGELLETTVIARDEETDLVLLRCSELTDDNFVSLGDISDEQANLRTGRMLLSPSSRSDGCVSVIGSKVFGSRATANKLPKVLLGVFWDEKAKPIRILRVTPKGSAAKAGVKPNDLLLKIGVRSEEGGFEDKEVKSAADVWKILHTLEPNDRITLTLKRNGSETVTMVKLAPRPRRDIRRHAADFLVGGKSERRTGFKTVFTHDATLQQKECGGPVFDTGGNFVGINIARHSRAQFYAVPANVVKRFVSDSLKQ